MKLNLLTLSQELNFNSYTGVFKLVKNILNTSSHLCLEHLDHVVEAARASNLAEHVVELGVGHQLADVVEGSAEIVLGDGAVLNKQTNIRKIVNNCAKLHQNLFS